MSHTPHLVLILGDQLSFDISALKQSDKARDTVLMFEVAEETTYVLHHQKKLAFVLSAMRHFANALRAQGWTVDYIPLDDPANSGSFGGELARAMQRHGCKHVRATEASEWRVLQAMQGWGVLYQASVDLLPDDRFICSKERFKTWASGRKQLRMEYFYRDMRSLTGLLMQGDQPMGGQWNFDQENRKPPKTGIPVEPLPQFEPDCVTADVLALVSARFHAHIGKLLPFAFAVTHCQAQTAFQHFLDHALVHFGDYQDAMLLDQPYLFHSAISQYINVGLLCPKKVCEAVVLRYAQGLVGINAAEGFIRQIIGWREYVRGIYWMNMPKLVSSNFLQAKRALPDFYWTAQTNMACMRAAISQTLEHAYAHHIQRLMITGNFALLAGVNPFFVHEWYLAVYIDAFEWVEAPNTIGMSQFADGGLLGSKPYAASGAYINRMSNYCKGCHYDVAQKAGEKACPFNYLYWDFLQRNRAVLKGNPRMGQTYHTLDQMSAQRTAEIAEDAQRFLSAL